MKVKPTQKRWNQQGSLLIVVVFLLVLFAGASAAITYMVSSAVETTSTRMDSERAFYAAESARIMDGNVTDLGGDEKLQGEKNPVGSEYPNCGSANLFIGYVGDSWKKARARHALCAWEGNWISDCDEINDLFGHNPIKSNLNITDCEVKGAPHTIIEGNLIIQKESKLNGFAQSKVNGDVCITRDSKLAGTQGQTEFNGTVYLEDANSPIRLNQSGNPGPNFKGCVYADKKLQHDVGGCPGSVDSSWCGIEGIEMGLGSSWGYADSSGE